MMTSRTGKNERKCPTTRLGLGTAVLSAEAGDGPTAQSTRILAANSITIASMIWRRGLPGRARAKPAEDGSRSFHRRILPGGRNSKSSPDGSRPRSATAVVKPATTSPARSPANGRDAHDRRRGDGTHSIFSDNKPRTPP